MKHYLRPGPVLAGQGDRVPAVESLAGVGRVAGLAVLAGQRHGVPVPGPRAPHTARRRRAPRVAGVAGAVARVVAVTTVPWVVITTLETRVVTTIPIKVCIWVVTIPGIVLLQVHGVPGGLRGRHGRQTRGPDRERRVPGVRLRRGGSARVRCHVSRVSTCHVSRVSSHVSPAACRRWVAAGTGGRGREPCRGRGGGGATGGALRIVRNVV